MSFYRRRPPPSMGFAWLAPVVQLVGGALSSQPVNNEFVPERQNPLVPIAIGAVGLGIVGGLVYFLVRK